MFVLVKSDFFLAIVASLRQFLWILFIVLKLCWLSLSTFRCAVQPSYAQNWILVDCLNWFLVPVYAQQRKLNNWWEDVLLLNIRQQMLLFSPFLGELLCHIIQFFSIVSTPKLVHQTQWPQHSPQCVQRWPTMASHHSATLGPYNTSDHIPGHQTRSMAKSSSGTSQLYVTNERKLNSSSKLPSLKQTLSYTWLESGRLCSDSVIDSFLLMWHHTGWWWNSNPAALGWILWVITSLYKQSTHWPKIEKITTGRQIWLCQTNTSCTVIQQLLLHVPNNKYTCVRVPTHTHTLSAVHLGGMVCVHRPITSP